MNHADELLPFSTKALSVWQSVLAKVPHLSESKPVPTTIGIKVADQTALLAAVGRYFALGDQVHLGPVNGVRSIASIRKQTPLLGEIRFIKILQRRPGRTDPLGPEHLDLLVPAQIRLETLCETIGAAGFDCELEKNDFHGWLSIRVEGIEFKLVHELVWESCIKEMQQLLTVQ
ncbi:MAG: hypothetical protein U0517_02635 [Candidatus Andersenbacteria bacterium]